MSGKQRSAKHAGSVDIGAAFNQAMAFHRAGRLTEAEAVYRKITAVRPDHFDSQHLLGVVSHQRGDHAEAVRQIDAALKLNPNSVSAHSNRGSALKELEQFDAALASYDKALALKPDHPEILYNRAGVLQTLGQHADALASLDRALTIKPDYIDALINRGTVLYELDRLDAALASYDRALALNPNHAQAHNNRGTVLRRLEQPEEAIASYDRAIAIMPGHAEAFYNRGIALAELRRHDAALADYERALALKPDHAEALNNRAATLKLLDRPEEAMASFDRALALKPNYPEALFNRGWLLVEQSRLADALADFDRAIALRPDHAEAHFSRGIALERMSRLEEALPSYERAMALDPSQKYLAGTRLHVKMHLCDWRDFDADCARLVASVADGKIASTPFLLLPLPSSPAAQRQCATLYAADRCPAAAAPLWNGERYHHDRIRIAYLSADLHDHATAYLMAGLFERHDRSTFETVAISFGPAQDGEMRRRLTRSFDRFIDVAAESDHAAAKLVRDLEVDIAVDLKGFTQGARTAILAARPAPIQVSYIGYPGTMGASYIDYLIADRFVVPPEQYEAYSERIAWLPDSYQVNDQDRKISDVTPSRAQAGLPEHGFVFCSFNNTYKITPDVFDVWMRLLREIDGSVLWLLEANSSAPNNLRRGAEQRGVSAERLIFAPKLKLEDHLARQRLAHLFLDTLYYNAHTTASDALWSGLPVVTCPGTTFASRVAGSLLHAVGVPELVTTSLADYEALALALARDPAQLAALKSRLARNRATHPLFDTERFARHIEAAYTTMWQRQQRGDAPESFAVAAES